jgi:hypothetical protein
VTDEVTFSISVVDRPSVEISTVEEVASVVTEVMVDV